jgi:hypothetical protein
LLDQLNATATQRSYVRSSWLADKPQDDDEAKLVQCLCTVLAMIVFLQIDSCSYLFTSSSSEATRCNTPAVATADATNDGSVHKTRKTTTSTPPPVVDTPASLQAALQCAMCAVHGADLLANTGQVVAVAQRQYEANKRRSATFLKQVGGVMCTRNAALSDVTDDVGQRPACHQAVPGDTLCGNKAS